MQKKNKKFNNGFSLVETLVAIFILTMGIAAAMSVAGNSLRASFFARDRIAAYFLAQEAIEMIKNKRDENGIANCNPICGVSSVDWLQGIATWAFPSGPCGENTNVCGVDSTKLNNEIDSCANFNNCILTENTEGLMGHTPVDSTHKATKFTRKINMKKISDDEAEINVVVSWPPSNQLQVVEHIMNWHPLSP